MRQSLSVRLPAVLLVFAAGLLALPEDAAALTVKRGSAHSATETFIPNVPEDVIYEDEFPRAIITDSFGGSLTSGFGASNVSIRNGPSGLTATAASRGCGAANNCADITLGFTGDISSLATVDFYLTSYIWGGDVYGGQLFIRPTVDELRLSVPTNDATVSEAGSTSTFQVRLGAAPAGDVTIAVSVSDSTEAEVSPSTLTFTSTNYATAQTITVTGVDDSISGDGTQTYNIVLNPASTADSGYDGLSNVQVEMRTTDDTGVNLELDNNVISENGGSATVTASIDTAAASAITVTVAAAAGANTVAGNFTQTGTTLTIAQGATTSTGTVTITGVDDSTTDGDKTVTVSATAVNAQGDSIGVPTSQTLTIQEDELSLSIDNPSVTEGDSSNLYSTMTFTVTLSPAWSGGSVMVDYEDAATGTASNFEAEDYLGFLKGTLTFSPGETSQTIDVQVTGDRVSEGNETIIISLSNARNATIATGTGTGTIIGDDGGSLSIDDPSVTEGNSGSTTMTFTVTINPAATGNVTVNYAAGTGTATADTDYTAITAGTLTIAAGETSETIDVSVTGDTNVEGDETIIIILGNASSGYNIVDGTGTGTIQDDDLTLSISDPSVLEVNASSSPNTSTLSYTVTLSQAWSGADVTVDYEDAASGTATSGVDYTAITAGTLTIAAGDRSGTIDVTVTGDDLDEADETIVISLSDAVNATISDASGTGTITDNDTSTLSIANTSVTEGDSGSADMTFTVSISNANSRHVVVNYADAGTGTATPGTDYTAITGGILTFRANSSADKTFTVSVTGDTDNENDETIIVRLSNLSPHAAFAGGGTTLDGMGTITNDDSGGDTGGGGGGDTGGGGGGDTGGGGGGDTGGGGGGDTGGGGGGGDTGGGGGGDTGGGGGDTGGGGGGPTGGGGGGGPTEPSISQDASALNDALDGIVIDPAAEVPAATLTALAEALGSAAALAAKTGDYLQDERVDTRTAVDAFGVLVRSLELAASAVSAGSNLDLANLDEILSGLGSACAMLDESNLYSSQLGEQAEDLVSATDTLIPHADAAQVTATIGGLNGMLTCLVEAGGGIDREFFEDLQGLSQKALTAVGAADATDDLTVLAAVPASSGVDEAQAQAALEAAGLDADAAAALAGQLARFVNPQGAMVGAQIGFAALSAADVLTDVLSELLSTDLSLSFDAESGLLRIMLEGGAHVPVFITQVAAVPEGTTEGIRVLADYSAWLVSRGLAVVAVPATPAPIAFAGGLESMDLSLAISADGRLEITGYEDGATFSGSFGYNALSGGSGSALLTPPAEGSDPASLDTVWQLLYGDEVRQRVQPFFAATDKLLASLAGFGFSGSVSRDAGVLTVSGLTFRPSYWLTPLTAADQEYLNVNGGTAGVAYRAVDANDDGQTDFQIITSRGVQVAYGIP